MAASMAVVAGLQGDRGKIVTFDVASIHYPPVARVLTYNQMTQDCKFGTCI